MPTQLLRLPDILRMTGLSRSCVLDMSSKGTLDFPQPFKIGRRAVAWKAQEIENWINSCAAMSKGGQHENGA